MNDRPRTEKRDLRETMMDAVCDLLDALWLRDTVTEVTLMVCDRGKRYTVAMNVPEREIRVKQPQDTDDNESKDNNRPRASVGTFDPDTDSIG